MMTVAGIWNVTVKTPMGDQAGTFTVAIDGDSFTGKLSSPMMGEMSTQDGKVAGNGLTWALTWKMDMKVPMPMTLDCEAVIDGDTLTGKVVAGAFGAMALTGTRKS